MLIKIDELSIITYI